MKKTNLWLLGLTAVVVLGVSHTAFSQNDKGIPHIKGLPASDVLGSEDIWDNPTFVGGVIDGGPTASSEY